MVFYFQSNDGTGLYLRISQLLSESVEAHFSVAWITMGAFDMINSEEGEYPRALEGFLSNEAARLVITVGLSNRGTSYNALEALLELQNNCEGTLIIYVRHTEGGGRIFHPKAYLFRDEQDCNYLIAGSNNLSRYGLGQSEEASIEINSEIAPAAIQQAIDEMFDIIEVDDILGPSRLLDNALLEELLESGIVLREGTGAWRRNRSRQRGQSIPGLFTPTSVPGGLPPSGSGRPQIPEPEPEPEPEQEEDIDYIGVSWGSPNHPVPLHDGIRFTKIATLTDVAGAYGAAAPEIRLPSHRGNQIEQRAIDLELTNVVDFFQYPAENGYVNGVNVIVIGYQLNNEEVIEIQGIARLWYNPSGAGGGSGYRLNFTADSDNILRGSNEGGGDVILIDRDDEDRYLFRFISPEYNQEWVAQMNRENQAGIRYCFINNGTVVEIPEDE